MRADRNGRPRFVQNNCAPEGRVFLDLFQDRFQNDHIDLTTPASSPHSLPLPRYPACQHPTLARQLDLNVDHPGKHNKGTNAAIQGMSPRVPFSIQHKLAHTNCSNIPSRPPPLPLPLKCDAACASADMTDASVPALNPVMGTGTGVTQQAAPSGAPAGSAHAIASASVTSASAGASASANPPRTPERRLLTYMPTPGSSPGLPVGPDGSSQKRKLSAGPGGPYAELSPEKRRLAGRSPCPLPPPLPLSPGPLPSKLTHSLWLTPCPLPLAPCPLPLAPCLLPLAPCPLPLALLRGLGAHE